VFVWRIIFWILQQWCQCFEEGLLALCGASVSEEGLLALCGIGESVLLGSVPEKLFALFVWVRLVVCLFGSGERAFVFYNSGAV